MRGRSWKAARARGATGPSGPGAGLGGVWRGGYQAVPVLCPPQEPHAVPAMPALCGHRLPALASAAAGTRRILAGRWGTKVPEGQQAAPLPAGTAGTRGSGAQRRDQDLGTAAQHGPEAGTGTGTARHGTARHPVAPRGTPGGCACPGGGGQRGVPPAGGAVQQVQSN